MKRDIDTHWKIHHQNNNHAHILRLNTDNYAIHHVPNQLSTTSTTNDLHSTTYLHSHVSPANLCPFLCLIHQLSNDNTTSHHPRSSHSTLSYKRSLYKLISPTFTSSNRYGCSTTRYACNQISISIRAITTYLFIIIVNTL